MRQIEIEDGLRVRFPARSEDFDQGFEVGMAAVLMTAIGGEFERSLPSDSIELVRCLAERLGYHLVLGDSHDGVTEVLFKTGRPRPKLQLVHSVPATNAAPLTVEGPARRGTPTLVRVSDSPALR